jgi:hypothetical protein
MIILAIFQSERVYEGNHAFLNAVYPMPTISRVLIGRHASDSASIFGDYLPAVAPLFREDSFDPTTRLRRGRFYISHNQLAQYQRDRVSHYPYRPPTDSMPLAYEFDSYTVLQPVVEPACRNQGLIVLGDLGFQTAWRIVGSERLFNGETLFTLKSASASCRPSLAAPGRVTY